MNITVKKLTPELCGDFLDYFENTAFTDHEEWAYCYCLECHLGMAEDEKMKDKNMRRALAERLILSGKMQGYLAYDGNKTVGWCSADDKQNYRLLCCDAEYRTDEDKTDRIKSIYCFDIAHDYRGNGIAGLMLDRICTDAKSEGYQYVETYPFTDESMEYQYHGSRKMYERHGFEIYAERNSFFIMRRTKVN